MTNLKTTNLTLMVKMEDGLLATSDWKPEHNSILNIGTLFKNEREFHSERYKKLQQEIASDEAIKTDVDKAAYQVGKQFLGCVIDFKYFKLYVTSVNIFVHLDDDFDDCANRMLTKGRHVFAKIREKPNYKSSSYKISIYTGSLELLAIGGVVVNTNMASSFLGSSVKPPIAIMSHGKETVSRDIYVKKAPAEVATSERLLRQYYKIHASKKWSFHMKSLADMGFCPLNPLRVEEHSLFSTNADPALLCQSIIFKAYALRSVDALNLPVALQKFKASRLLKNQEAKLESAALFGDLKEGMKVDGKWPKVVEALAKLEAGSPDLFANERATRVRNKKLLLSFADFGFFSSVAQKNAKIIKATEKLFLK